ncbi:MAG: MFS transporter [Streptosporangiaceae bacterium]
MTAAAPDDDAPELTSRSLWRHRDFMLLWTGQAISEIGSAVTIVALPLVAVVLLNATTFEVGLLSAATTVCFLLVALPAGLIVDRVAKRRLMIVCDIARMLILGSVVVAAALGALTMAQLFAVGFLTGLATVFFDVAYQSYVPALVARDQLHDGNGKLGATQAFSAVAGPGLGGALFGLLRAGAMAADAISFAVSTATLLLIRGREPGPQESTAPGQESATSARAGFAGLRKELFAGLGFVFGHPVLRKIAACTGTANLFGSISGALEILFLVRVVHVPPADTGLLISVGSLGGVLGGVLAGRISKWIGTARVIWFSVLVFGVIPIMMPLTEPGPRLVLFPIAVAGLSFTVVLYNIAQVSYRQLITPPHLLGRMNAAMRWIVWGTIPLGGLLGGVLGSLIGIRATLWVGVIGSWAAAFWVYFSPLRKMRDIPSDAIQGSEPSAAEADAQRSAAADAQQGEHDEHDRREGEQAVSDHDGDGKVPLRRNS